MNFTSTCTRVARLRFLVALPAGLVALVALGARQTVHLEALEDPPHAGVADLDVVIAAQVHRDLQGAEVVVLAQVDDLADDLALRGVWAHVRPRRPVPEALLPELLVAVQPLVEGRSADAVVATGGGDVAGDLLGVSEYRQAVPDLALLLS